MKPGPRRARIASVALLGVAGVGAALVAVGLSHSPARGQGGPVAAPDPAPVASASPGDRILLATGPLLGTLEPCRCSEGMLGGLPRRASLVQRFAKASPLLLDLGDLGQPDDASETRLELVEAAAVEVLEAIAGLSSGSGGAVVALGCSELRLGPERLARIAKEHPRTTWLASNVLPGGAAPESGIFRWVTEPGEYHLFAVVDPTLVPAGDAWRVIPLADVFGGVPERPSVVLYHGDSAAAARDFDDVDSKRVSLVICGHGEHPEPTRQLKKGVTLVTLGTKGQSVRGLALDGANALRAEQSHDLDGLVPDHAQVRAILDRLYDLEAERLPDLEKRKPDEQGGTFLGSEACIECHESEGKLWRESRHAHALEKVRAKDPKRARLAECQRCHVVGRDFEGGWNPDTRSAGLDAVGCESCHGPGSNHAARARESASSALGFGRPPGKWALRWRGRCLSCHDPANSPGFDLDGYLGKIRHWKNGDR